MKQSGSGPDGSPPSATGAWVRQRPFHERFGFEVVGEEEVLGVTNYFMLRRTERRNG